MHPKDTDPCIQLSEQQQALSKALTTIQHSIQNSMDQCVQLKQQYHDSLNKYHRYVNQHGSSQVNYLKAKGKRGMEKRFVMMK